MGVEESSESTDEQQVSEQAPDLPTGSTKLFNSSRVHSGTPKEPRAKLYSQLLGRYVPFNTCIACGERGHVARNPQCSLYARNKGKKNNFHTGKGFPPPPRNLSNFNFRWADYPSATGYKVCVTADAHEAFLTINQVCFMAHRSFRAGLP